MKLEKLATQRGVKEAILRIRGARETGARHLDLSSLNLLRIPDEVFDLKSLEALYVHDNQIVNLPEAISELQNLFKLHAYRNNITAIPSHIGSLRRLDALYIHDNQIADLPENIGDLQNLVELYAYGNSISSIPTRIGDLERLEKLSLHSNRIRHLPPGIGRLQLLTCLWLHHNLISSLPKELSTLQCLRTLSLKGNSFTSIPEELQRLHNLSTLDLSNNRIEHIPPWLPSLSKIEKIKLEGNPLPEAYIKLSSKSAKNFFLYAKSLANESEPLYEAKLLLLGDGNVGKSSLLAALRDEPFVENRPTTHGLEVGLLEVFDRSQDRIIRLNAWDFGGQTLYRTTHQLFLSQKAIYLVVWHPREGFEKNDVRGWIERIRLRVGPAAQIILISTHCSSTRGFSEYDRAQLLDEYGDMIVGTHEVDSKTREGIEELQMMLASHVSQELQTPDRISPSWRRVRDALLLTNKLHINYGDFINLCRTHGVEKSEAGVLAELFHELGYLVYFDLDEDLKDTLIIRPDWLIKTIESIFKDSPTREAGGVLTHRRLPEIWKGLPFTHGVDSSRLEEFIRRLLQKFEFLFRLNPHSSLIVQLVPGVCPAQLPWHSNQPLAAGISQVSLVCRLEGEPEGLIPWLIVKTARFSTGLHWQRGLFLSDSDGSEALIEYKGRELRLSVRGPYPVYFLGVVSENLRQLLSRFKGLEYDFLVPYQHTRESGVLCSAEQPLRVLRNRIAIGRREISCTSCGEDVFEIERLLSGIGDRTGTLRSQLDHLAGSISEEMAAPVAGSRLAEMFWLLISAFNSEARHCPGLFTLVPKSLSKLDFRNWGRVGYQLNLWCEYPGDQHPTCLVGSHGEGEYHFKGVEKRMVELAPYASLVARVLLAAIPHLARDAGHWFEGVSSDKLEQIAQTMQDVYDELQKDATREFSGSESSVPKLLTVAEGASRRALMELLNELDSTKTWGGLKAEYFPEFGDYRWLCEHHRKELRKSSQMPRRPSTLAIPAG